MSSINTVTLSGSLAADPEVRWTSDDGESSIVRLGVIVKSSRKDDNGDWQEQSSIIDVECFGRFGTLIARKLVKFDKVAVSGFLRKDEWEKDGEKRSKIVVQARDLDSEGLYRKADGSDKPAAAPAAAVNESGPAEAAPAAHNPSTSEIPF